MSDCLSYFLAAEEQQITSEVQQQFFTEGSWSESIKKEKLKQVNMNLLMADDKSISFRIHSQLINSLISVYVKCEFKEHYSALQDIFQYEVFPGIEEVARQNAPEIPGLLEELHVAFLNSVFSFERTGLKRKKSKHHLREKGAVYTLREITRDIVSGTIKKAIQRISKNDTDCKNNGATEITCLDFGCGTGRFYFEAIEILREDYSLPLDHIVCQNLFALDVDEVAISVLRCKLISLFKELNSNIIGAMRSNILTRNALIPRTKLSHSYKISLDSSNDFNSVFKRGGFDVVFSNPPYKLLKVNRKIGDHQLNDYYMNHLKNVQEEIRFFRNSELYHYSIEGMLNYYRLSIEMILQLAGENGTIGIICPSSLFADITSARLRRHLLMAHNVYFIRYFPEAAKLFENVSQSTVIFNLQKGTRTKEISIEIPGSTFKIDLNLIGKVFPANFEIPLIDKTGWAILRKISRQNKIKEMPFIRNKRGELDLTHFRAYITEENTGWRLVRGNMISSDGLVDRNGEYVRVDEFLKKKSPEYKRIDFKRKRLVCQQVSNIDIQRRLKFVFCEKTDILANSCNYIVSSRDDSDLLKLNYILNSNLLNWRFKVTSSNNHINNYELDELPVVDLDEVDINDFSDDERKNNEIICRLYGLNKRETAYLLKV